MTPFAFDTETGLIQYNVKAPPVVCVSYAFPKGWVSTKLCPQIPDLTTGLLHHSEAEPSLRKWLDDPELILIGANTSYDMGVVMQNYPKLLSLVWQAYEDDRVQDVLLRQKIIDIAQGTYWSYRPKKGAYSLKGLTERYFKIDLDKGENTWRLRYIDLLNVPLSKWPEDAKQYAISDAEATLLVYLEQERHFHDLLDDSCRQGRAAWWLHLMTAWGICTDQAAVSRLEHAVKLEHDELQKALLAEGLVKYVGKKVVEIRRDTKAAKKVMVRAMSALGRDVALTPKGGIALDKNACKESEDITLEGYAELTHLSTLLSKDIPGLQKPEIHSRFEVLLETGRTSSSGPNIQNPSRTGGVRECYVPRKGCVFVDADYDIIELRTFAQACLWSVGTSKLAEALNRGYDPHLSLGAQLINITYDEAVSRKRDPDVKDARQYAKPGNFGFPGGMGASRFKDYAKESYGIEFTLEQAVKIRETWFETWPEAKLYFEWITDEEKNDWYFDVDHTRVCRVKQFVSNRYRGGCSYSEAANTRFQGLAADIGKASGFLIARECYDESRKSVLFGSRIVNFIHDQHLVESPEALAHECAQRVGQLMVEAAKPFIPDVPATCTPCLASCWSKGAEAVYDDNKRLMVWEPVFAKLEASASDGDSLAAKIIKETKARHAAFFSQTSSSSARVPRFSGVAREMAWHPRSGSK